MRVYTVTQGRNGAPRAWRRRLGVPAAVLTACVLGGTTGTLAQDVTIGPLLRAGDEFRLELVRIRESSDRPAQDSRSRTVVNVRVVSATPAGTVLDWVPADTVFDNPRVAQDPLLTWAAEAVADLQFRLTLNADGELTGLANEAEIVPKLQSVLDLALRDLEAKVPAAQRKALDDLVRRVLSPGALVGTATREAQIYFGLNGVALAPGERVEAAVEQPNPIGDGTLPATFAVHLASVTPETASLRTTMTYDTTVLLQSLVALSKQAGKPIPPEGLAKMPPMTMADDATYLFDRTLGLMREVLVNRRIAIENLRRFDGWEIRLLSDPAR
jgi:hypothetical protein